MAVTLGSWRESLGEQSAIITPNNVLVNQYLEACPSLPVLHKQDSYGGGYFFTRAREKARDSKTVLANYYTYAANRLHRQNLIVDEAHNLLHMLRERWAGRLWQRTWNFPDEMTSMEDFIEWAETQKKPKLDTIVKQVIQEQAMTLEYTEEFLRGQPSKVIKLIPLTIRDKKPWLWNKQVSKIVLMSATISPWEIYELGLDARRVLYINVDSPIPAANRPIIIDPVANMSWDTRSFAVDLMATRLKSELDTSVGKGVIHATYDTAARLRARLGAHPRIIWHTRSDRQQRYNEFLNSPVDQAKVFVASGFNEGIDLKYDAARWQIILEIPYLSLGDTAVRVKRDRQPEWYQWEAVKTIKQTIGRVSRAPDDYGETRIWDSRFSSFLERNRNMFSQDELNSVRYV